MIMTKKRTAVPHTWRTNMVGGHKKLNSSIAVLWRLCVQALCIQPGVQEAADGGSKFAWNSIVSLSNTESWCSYLRASLRSLLMTILTCTSVHRKIQGGSNMTGTDLYVNKPHCAAVRLVYIQISPGHIWTTLYFAKWSGKSYQGDEGSEGYRRRWRVRVVTQLISNVHYTGEWPRDVTELSMTVLQKKPRVTKYSDHSTISRDSGEDT